MATVERPGGAEPPLAASQAQFVRRALRRKKLFLALSVIGVVAGLGLAVLYTVLRVRNPHFEVSARAVIVVLVLLNARQNLRQYRYAEVLEKAFGASLGGSDAR